MGKYEVSHLGNQAKTVCDLCGETKYIGRFFIRGGAASSELEVCRDCIERLAVFIKREKAQPIRFNMETMKWEGLKLSEVKEWEKQFDRVDVAAEFIKIRAWILRKKGTEQAHKRNWRTFIVNWLRRSQVKATQSSVFGEPNRGG
ncbi:MAG: hypothetical protein ABFD82_17960 [Syntrophaceae bacterium]